MVELHTQTLDRIFLALGHPVRRQILVRLAEAPATVTDIAAPFEMSLNAISKHLKVLENANLIQRQVIGREHYCSPNRESLAEVANWLAYYQSFWSSGFEAMEAELIAKKQAKSLDKD